MRKSYCLLLAALFALKGLSQNNPAAKILYEQAKADTLAKRDSIGALNFYKSAQEELKIISPDYKYATRRFMDAAEVMFVRVKNLKLANDYYNDALATAYKANNTLLTAEILRELGTLYDKSQDTYAVFSFPSSDKMETLEAYFSIFLKPEINKSGKYVIALTGGSNDGVYPGAQGFVYGKHTDKFKDRSNTKLGSMKITQVYPNFSIAVVDLYKSGDPFYDVYMEDMAAVPIRFPKKVKKDIFLQVSLLNIKFVDNSRDWLVHPRTLMYYASPQLEKEVYDIMKKQGVEIYEMLNSDSNAAYHAPVTTGRFKGKSMMEVLRDTKEEDIQSFFSFVRSYPGKYMGGTWKFSEVYATWIINNSPMGSNEAMDSLLAYSNNENLFNRFANEHAFEIKNNFFATWLTDAQDFSYVKDFTTAFKWNSVMQKASMTIKNDSLLAWSYFNHGLISSETTKDSDAIEYYRKAIPLFKNAGDKEGESFAVNNIGSALNKSYRYKESQPYFEQALQIRLQIFLKDTSDAIKQEVARAHSGIGYSLFMQSKYKEAIDEYLKGTALLEKITILKAKQDLAPLYSSIGKSFEKMGQYKEAADYYDLEYGVQKSLGDEEAMADALDNKAHLLSLIGKNLESLEGYQEAYRLHIKTNNTDDAGYSMSSIGQMLWTLGKLDSAIAAHAVAIELRVKANDKNGEAYSWKKLGELYKNNGQPQKSFEAYNRALQLYRLIGNKEEEANVAGNVTSDQSKNKKEAKELEASLLEDFASNYSNVKDYSNALKYYRDALNVYRHIQSKSKMADATYNIATVYYNDKQYEQSEKILDSAIALQNEINDQAGLLNSYIYKGSIQQFFYGNYTKAMGFTKHALMLAEATTSLSSIASTRSSIAALYENIGTYDSAAFYLESALTIYKKLEDKSNIADVYNSKGYLYSELADFLEARKYFDLSLQIAEQSGNKSTKAIALDGISQVELLSGNFYKAIEISDTVMRLWIQENNPWGIAGEFISVGNILNRQSDFINAIANYQKADSMYKILRMEKASATPLNNIGDIYFGQNDYEKALPYFFEALKILQKTNEDKAFIALIKANIGETYIYQKKYADAEKWLKESQDTARKIKNISRIYTNDIILARLKIITKDYTSAKTFFDEAYTLLKETKDKPNMVLLETEWGKWFYLNNDLVNAEKHLQNAVTLSQEMGFKTHIWKAYSTLSEIREQQNNTLTAIAELEKAIKVIEELKSRLSGGEEAKKVFSSDESVVDLYQRMAKYLKKLGRNDEALAYIEKSNIENLKLRFKNDNATNAKEEDEANRLKEKKTEINQYVKQTTEELGKPQDQQNKEKISRLEKMTTVAEADYQQFIIDLAKKYPGRTDLQQIDARQFKQERKYIPKDVALLSYLITDQELSVFVVMKDTLLIKDIPIDRKLLEQKIKQFYLTSSRPEGKNNSPNRGGGEDKSDAENKNLNATASQLSQELYTILLEPAIDAIAGKKRIAIVPSGLLSFVPFHSLSIKNSQGNIEYFGEQKQVFYVNKITTVTNGRNEALNNLKIIAVGNADKSLANAETEVKTLHQIFPTSMIYIGSDATKQKVLGTQGEYNILHLATHGILDYSNAENSYLVFASDKTNGDDGKLKINDIYKIKDLDRFRMVTLSACETAVVQNIADGWPISTASAFIEAGVPTVIATLWKVDDKATSLLIEKFYENMKTMDKVAALQSAQVFLRNQKEFADPYYWAPFQLVGLWQ